MDVNQKRLLFKKHGYNKNSAKISTISDQV